MTATAETTTITGQVARHLAGMEFEAIDVRTLARAKVRLIDSLGNIAAGHRAQGNDAVLQLAGRWGGTPEATVLVHGLRVPAQTAAMANAVMMRSYDFEAIGAEGPDRMQVAAHISGTTVPVALAVAERQRSTGRQLLTALVLGDDLASRLAAASGFDVYSGQDNTGTVNGLGGTAAAGKLLDLDEAQLRHALGIAVNQLSGTVANIFDQTLAFKLPMAFAARNSIVSAELAQLGFTGPADAIGGRHGFLDMYCAQPVPDRITHRLGEEFYGDCVIKPWSACRASHPSLDACVRLVTENTVDLDAVESVRIHVTPRTLAGFVGQPFEPGACPEVSGAFSIRFTAATALMCGTVRPEHLHLAHMQDPRLQALLEKITLIDSLPPHESLTAEVELLRRDGPPLRSRVDAPRGDIYTAPLSEAEILDKYYANVAFGGRIGHAAATEAIDIVNNLESVEDISALVRLFAPGQS
ncbi:MmgE/PrpD family protein [Arthrobacter sp. I2-34]|uniref:MmgE/PrpD family protein n=1 Tax=Arthrobacter hankyongi TaxID=2904801 RepID=A0ABS9L472_9MICC|nr:MmgE/PrpD family protein [Arthrobacter hankyongi]MCG2621443.1 MmgE/PrpD family protein [Arthrobacter hankyongi]